MIPASLLTSLMVIFPATARAERIEVRHPQGSAHGFVEVVTLEGQRIGIGDLIQSTHGDTVTSRLKLDFFDGSLDDETTMYSQRGQFKFIRDHHIQRGPSFPQPADVTIDATRGSVSMTDMAGKTTQTHIDMPADVYNGMASSMLMNVLPQTPQTVIAVVIAGDKPRIAHLSMKNAGEVSFSLAGVSRKAIDYVVHVELGGLAGVVAPVIGKEPADYHLWISDAESPAFIREEGQLYEGGPIWRIQQISAAFSK